RGQPHNLDRRWAPASAALLGGEGLPVLVGDLVAAVLAPLLECLVEVVHGVAAVVHAGDDVIEGAVDGGTLAGAGVGPEPDGRVVDQILGDGLMPGVLLFDLVARAGAEDDR